MFMKIATLLFLMFSFSSFASEFSFKELYQKALESNEDLKAFAFLKVSKEELVSPMGSLPDPVLGFEVMDYPMEKVEGDKYKLADKQITLSQMIPMWGKLSLKSESMKSESLAVNEQLRAKEFKLKVELLALYLDYFLAFKKVDILQDKKRVMEQMIAVMRTEYSSGSATKADLLILQTEHANLLGMEIEAESMKSTLLAKIKAKIAASMDLRDKKPVEPEKPKEEEIYKESEKLFDLALDHSPAILSMREMENAKRSELSFAKREYFPDVELMAGYKMSEPSMMNPDAIDTASLKVAINIPLWAFSKQNGEHHAAIAAHNSASAARKNEELVTRSEIESMSSSIGMLFKKLDLYDGGLVALAHQSYASNRAAYSAKRLPFSSLLQSINIQSDTDYARYETLAMLLKEIAKLETMVGLKLSEGER